MLEPLVQYFEKLVDEFSWGRLFLLLTAFGTILATVIGYEAYTGAFYLEKLDKEIQLLENLAELSGSEELRKNSELNSLHATLVKELAEAASSEDVLSGFSTTTKKVLASLAPWLLLAFIIAIASKGKLEVTVIAGIAFFAIPFAVIAAFLPNFTHSWINYLAYPIAHTVLAVTFVMLWDKRKKMKRDAA